MAWSFTTPFKPSKKTGIILAMKDRMVAAGWEVVSSGDGTSYAAPGSPTPDLITTETMLANARAWFRIQAPDGREYTWQKINDADGAWYNAAYRVKYSAVSKFTNGPAGATTTPSATDEVIIAGGGSDASPTMIPLMPTSGEGLWFVACGADDAAPYGVWCVAYAAADSIYSRFHFIHDPVSNAHADDADPVVVMLSQNMGNNELLAAGLDTYDANYIHSAWVKHGLAGAGFVPVRASSNGIAGAGATDPYTSKDVETPMQWVRDGGQATPNAVIKGTGTVARWHMPRRAIGSTATVTTSRDRIIFGDISLPWDGSEPAA